MRGAYEITEGEPLSGPFTQQELAVAAAEFRARGIRWAEVRDLNEAMARNRVARVRAAEGEKAAAEAAKGLTRELTFREVMTDALAAPELEERLGQRAKFVRNQPAGRPSKEPAWLAEVAALYAKGLSLRRALRASGVVIAYAEARNIYRLKRFKELVKAYRMEFGLS